MFIKKIYIYLFSGIFVSVIIFLLFLLQNTTATGDNTPSSNNLLTNEDINTNIEPSALNSNPVNQNDSSGASESKSDPPEAVARKFYQWYTTHKSPIQSGDYKTRTDLTPEFKNTIGIFYDRGINPGYDHVFCAQTSLPKKFRLEAPMFNYDKSIVLIIFKDEKTGNNLFQMKLQNQENKWIIDDVWCPY